MGLFKKRAADNDEIERLRAEIAAMTARLEATDAAKQQLDRQVQGIDARFEAAEAARHQLGEQLGGITARLETPMDPPSEPPPASVGAADLDMVRARIERLVGRLDDVDKRITSISTELANQISEISNDLESLGSNEPPTDQVVDELVDAQTRLANEQARYQIAFRQDLAELADRLKRT